MPAHGSEGGLPSRAATPPLPDITKASPSRVLARESPFFLLFSVFYFSGVGISRAEKKGLLFVSSYPFPWESCLLFSVFVAAAAAAVLCWEMEGKKSSFVDEFFPQKEAAPPSESDILSSIFPPQSPVAVKDSFHYEFLPSRARKHGNEGLSSTERIGTPGEMLHINQIKNQDGLKKNIDTIMAREIAEPCLMSSSVYYGGRDDFIPESSSPYKSGSSYNCKDDEDASNSDLANRGEWWQGSFYY